MNNQIMQMLNQIKNIKNPKEAAMKALEQAANQGNPMAKNMLQKINSGDMNGAQQILGNFMNEQGLNIQEIQKQIQK
jgi:hypothetical protein|nr:MAG TPA: hypothetical protein [Bacteriophage sp.]